VRFGASELHTIAAILGGVASQDALKIIIGQYCPFADTFVFNGVLSVCGTYDL
jgi:amyloid beta precursor protein binding protein 1